MRIKAIRKLRNIKQCELAKQANISQPALSNIESGKRNPSISTIKRIAQILNCSVYELFEDDGDLRC